MENKKGNVSTVFLVIAIILIIVMGALLYMQKTEADKQINELKNNASELQETINNLQGKIDSISNTINDNGDTSTSEKDSTQFDVEFYELKDIAKEYRNYEDVKNYKDFIYDLDGDGTNEKITLSYKTGDVDNRVNYSVKLNGEVFSEGTSMDSIYIVDLNENDKNIEVVIFDDGPSDDPNYTIYSKNGSKMVELENIGGLGFKTDKKGTVLVPDVYTNSISPEIYFDYYFINNNQMERKFVNVDKVKDIDLQLQAKGEYFSLYFSADFNNKDKFFENAEDDAVERLKEFNIEKLNKEITFNILNFERVDYGNEVEDYKIYVELSDGRKGYIFHMQFAG